MTALLDPAPRADLPPRDDSLPADWPVDAAFSTSDVSAAPYERSGYRRAHGSDPIATIGALAVGLATIAAFATMNPRFKANDKREPTVVTLMELPDEPPPAPPPSEPPPPDAPPPVARIVAPTPVIALPERPVLSAPPAAQPVAAPAPPRPAPAVAPPAPENLGDISARVVFKPPKPQLPRETRRLHEEGTVQLALLLTMEGRVGEISVARSSGFPRLDRTALEWVRDWRWSPFMQNGKPVMVRGFISIDFRGPRPHGRRGRGSRLDDDQLDQAGDPV